ncbi:Hypothetical predicted protein, partial [Paramuricea clavata]
EAVMRKSSQVSSPAQSPRDRLEKEMKKYTVQKFCLLKFTTGSERSINLTDLDEIKQLALTNALETNSKGSPKTLIAEQYGLQECDPIEVHVQFVFALTACEHDDRKKLARLQIVSKCYISAAEFAVLLVEYESCNPDFPYDEYMPFNLDDMDESECLAEFRFEKQHIPLLAEALRIPAYFITEQRSRVRGIEGLCMLLKRVAYPCRYSDMIPRFARPVPMLTLEQYAEAIHNNCFGFIDGTVRPISRPRENQCVVYNGHKHVHALKFQSVVIPNGLIAKMYGPVEGKRHDSGMLAESGLMGQLELNAHSMNDQPMCLYGDPAYPLRVHLQAPYRIAQLTQQMRLFNTLMSSTRVSVEWLFGDIIHYFKFVDFKKSLKIGLSSLQFERFI